MTTLKFKTNLNCGSCVAAVKPHLDADHSIHRWNVNTASPDKLLTVEGVGLSEADISRHVSDAGFQILERVDAETHDTEEKKSFIETYLPLLLVFAYLLGTVLLVEAVAGSFDWMRAMNNFMGGFFISFSFFKLLNLTGFVDSFQTYDVLARPVRAYGFAYPFIELALGIAYLVQLVPIATNAVTLVIMVVGMVGVAQALLQKRRIQCACLGAVFNLPMSKVTLVEDGLMAGMAVIMLVALAGM